MIATTEYQAPHKPWGVWHAWPNQGITCGQGLRSPALSTRQSCPTGPDRQIDMRGTQHLRELSGQSQIVLVLESSSYRFEPFGIWVFSSGLVLTFQSVADKNITLIWGVMVRACEVWEVWLIFPALQLNWPAIVATVTDWTKHKWKDYLKNQNNLLQHLTIYPQYIVFWINHPIPGNTWQMRVTLCGANHIILKYSLM